jgi:hypothetical protein
MKNRRCPIKGCNVPIPARLLMCGGCWRPLPRDLKSAVYAHYNHGQEQAHSLITRAYVAAARAAMAAAERLRAARLAITR